MSENVETTVVDEAEDIHACDVCGELAVGSPTADGLSYCEEHTPEPADTTEVVEEPVEEEAAAEEEPPAEDEAPAEESPVAEAETADEEAPAEEDPKAERNWWQSRRK